MASSALSPGENLDPVFSLVTLECLPEFAEKGLYYSCPCQEQLCPASLSCEPEELSQEHGPQPPGARRLRWEMRSTRTETANSQGGQKATWKGLIRASPRNSLQPSVCLVRVCGGGGGGRGTDSILCSVEPILHLPPPQDKSKVVKQFSNI